MISARKRPRQGGSLNYVKKMSLPMMVEMKRGGIDGDLMGED